MDEPGKFGGPAPSGPAPSGPAPSGPQPSGPQPSGPQPSGMKTAIEMGPVLLFAVAYAIYGIKAATGVLMVATVASLVVSYFVLGHVTPMLVMTTVLVVLFGTLTFALDDPRFIKMKPTAVNVLFAGVLGYGLLSGRLFLKKLLGEALHLTAEGWRQLTIRWIGFFLVLAALNEFVWRTMSETAWVNFKLFGILGMTFAFMVAQVGLLKRYADESASAPKSPIE
jgi:intracellular septation protein